MASVFTSSNATRNQPGFSTLLFGQPAQLGNGYALAAASTAIAVVLVLVALRKEILAYCVDPSLAEVSGVAVGVIHYLLITLVALATIIGMQVVGTLLVTALLVLPGATAQLIAARSTQRNNRDRSNDRVDRRAGRLRRPRALAIGAGGARVRACDGDCVRCCVFRITFAKTLSAT